MPICQSAVLWWVGTTSSTQIYPLVIPQPVRAEGSVNEFEMHAQNKKPKLEHSAK